MLYEDVLYAQHWCISLFFWPLSFQIAQFITLQRNLLLIYLLQADLLEPLQMPVNDGFPGKGLYVAEETRDQQSACGKQQLWIPWRGRERGHPEWKLEGNSSQKNSMMTVGSCRSYSKRLPGASLWGGTVRPRERSGFEAQCVGTSHGHAVTTCWIAPGTKLGVVDWHKAFYRAFTHSWVMLTDLKFMNVYGINMPTACLQ